MNEAQLNLDCWAVVELFGHQRISGKVTEETIAGSAMLRVDVPQNGQQAAYTRYFGYGAIYSINPTTEDIARGMVSWCSSEVVSRYKLPQKVENAPGYSEVVDEDDEDEKETFS